MGRRTLLAGSLGILLLLVPCPGVTHAQETDVVVFDLATDHTVVTDHAAHILFNLNTDNITHDSVTLGWNSMYNRSGSQLSGRVEIDVAGGTVRGELSELWICDGNCDELDHETYADKMDAGWTATFDAVLDTPGHTGSFAGTVSLDYSVAVAYDESPSTCGDEVCYICADRVCVFAETMSGTAAIEGLWDGEKLMLAYADRLEADANDMNFDGLRDTQFIMGRADVTLSGAVPAAAQTPEEPPPAEQVAAPEAEPEDQPVEADDAAAQPAPATEADPTPAAPDAEPEREETKESDGAAAAPPIDSGDKGGISNIALLVATMILMVLLFGASFAKKVLEFAGNTGKPVEEAERIAMLSPSMLTADPGDSPPLEGALDPPPPPPPAAGAEVNQFKRTPDEIGAGPAYSLKSLDDKSYVEGTRGSRAITYSSGTIVDVVGRAGDSVQVQVGDDPPIWINKKNLNYLRR